MKITEALADFCATVSIASLPAEVVERTPLLLLDLIGSIVRARSEAAVAPPLLATVSAMGLTNGAARVFGDPASYAPAGAALLNGAFAHALDFDDTHAAGTLHPGAPVVPAALAAAEMTGASGADILAAIVAGYETCCRIAVALPAGDHYARGFHPSATCGVFGAAAAAARVFGLDTADIGSALGIALSQSAGSLQFLADGAQTKPFQVGWAAMAGLTAATLARNGYKGPAEAIEGRHGFLQGYAPSPRPDRIVEDLGSVFELMHTGIKPYPSCRYGHAGIDAVLALRAEHGFQPEEVDSITYGLSNAGLLLVGAPIEHKRNPRNIVDAQFSAPFVLSCALVTGAMEWDSYQRLNDPLIRAILPKVDCIHDPQIEAEFPANMSGKITITARGQTFSRKVVVPLGEPFNFLSRDKLLAKFMALAAPVIEAQKADALATVALDLASLPDVGKLTTLAA
ncbi:MmgE/PrpD family protein [Sphingobium sp. Cam5-1]|nr:MmgE/PrpD family protein [Sphingobium sp. Cam5-1]